MNIESTIKRIIKRVYPELTGNMHLAQWGRVEAVHPIEAAILSTADNPAYCIDVQLLDANGKPDTAVDVFEKVPLPTTGAGNARGILSYPGKGTLVELGFILGLPSKPFIRTVLVEGVGVPVLAADDVLLSKDANNSYRIDNNNNIAEECQAIAERIAQTKQRLVVKNGGTVWVGNERDNVLQLLSGLMAEVIAIANALAAHQHGGVASGNVNTSPPSNAASYTSSSVNTHALKTKLDSITD